MGSDFDFRGYDDWKGRAPDDERELAPPPRDRGYGTPAPGTTFLNVRYDNGHVWLVTHAELETATCALCGTPATRPIMQTRRTG